MPHRGSSSPEGQVSTKPGHHDHDSRLRRLMTSGKLDAFDSIETKVETKTEEKKEEKK